jgi:hypothetical protein
MFGPTASRPVCLDVRYPSGDHNHIIFLLSELQLCSSGAPPLTREWICSLQLLLVLASAVILGTESSTTHDHILLSQFCDCPTWRASSPCVYIYIYPKEQDGPVVGSLLVALYDSQHYGNFQDVSTWVWPIMRKPWVGPNINHLLCCWSSCWVRLLPRNILFTEPIPRNGAEKLLVPRSLHSNGWMSQY